MEPVLVSRAWNLEEAMEARHMTRANRFIWWGLACMLGLSLTTTTTLVAMHHVQTQTMAAKLDFMISNAHDVQLRMSNLHEDIQNVQEAAAAQGESLAESSAAQGAQIEQLTNGVIMLLELLQSIFSTPRV
jgi:hypothetical protein